MEETAPGPYVTEEGVLVIPEGCELKYRWWVKGGQPLAETLKELKVSQTVWKRYVDEPYPEDLKKENYPLL
jgi:hypothetical protein